MKGLLQLLEMIRNLVSSYNQGCKYMKKYKRGIKILGIILLIVFLYCCGSCRATVKSSLADKQIVATVEEFPNYIFHLLSVARIGYDNEYSIMYKDSISEVDKKYLKQNSQYLNFADGFMGPLAKAFVFLPGYLNFKSKKEASEYFTLLNEVIRTANYSKFEERYSNELDKINLFMPFDCRYYLKSICRYEKIVFRIGEIFINNYTYYDKNIWPVEKKKLKVKALELNKKLKELNLISTWEQAVSIPFKTDKYQIILCTANQGGSDANSLGYDRNVFYYDNDLEYMLQFISHETGTHILIDKFNSIMKNNEYNFELVYKAYESLCKYYNERIMFKDTESLYSMKEYDYKIFLQIYSQIYDKNPAIKVEDLLEKGIKKFSNLNNQ